MWFYDEEAESIAIAEKDVSGKFVKANIDINTGNPSAGYQLVVKLASIQFDLNGTEYSDEHGLDKKPDDDPVDEA